MEQDQVTNFRGARDFHAFEPAGMSPTFAFRGELFRGILGVVDEHVGVMRELQKILVTFGGTGFVVGGINDGTTSGIEPIAQAALRMI